MHRLPNIRSLVLIRTNGNSFDQNLCPSRMSLVKAKLGGRIAPLYKGKDVMYKVCGMKSGIFVNNEGITSTRKISKTVRSSHRVRNAR